MIQQEKNEDQKGISLILVDEYLYEDYLRFCKFFDTSKNLMSNSDLIKQYCLQRP